MMSGELWIDARMLKSSGIGVYLRSLLPSLISEAQRQNVPVRVFAKPEDFVWFSKLQTEAPFQLVPFSQNIYSVGEQLFWQKQNHKACQLLWVPHYNAPIFSKIPLMITLHDLAHFDLVEHQSLLKKIYLRLVFSRVIQSAKKIICISRYTQKRLEEKFGPQPKSKVIYNGIDLSRLKPSTKRPDLKQKFILFVGNLKPHKNLKVILEALEILEKKGQQISLVVVGNRKNLQSYDEVSLKKLQSEKLNCLFAEDASDQELVEFYQSATALVFPSLYEGFGFPPLEAMSLDCPVIASDRTSIPEVVGNAALLFSAQDPKALSDKILEVQRDDVKEALLVAGRQQIKKFKFEKMQTETLNLIFQAFSEVRA